MITTEDLVAAWHDFYDYKAPEGAYEIVMREPDFANETDRATLDGLRRVLERDRERPKRVEA